MRRKIHMLNYINKTVRQSNYYNFNRTEEKSTSALNKMWTEPNTNYNCNRLQTIAKTNKLAAHGGNNNNRKEIEV